MTTKQEHGKEGHFNIYRLDQDSPCTNNGEHARVLATTPDCDGLYCRVDFVHGLRNITTQQVLRVAKKGGYIESVTLWKLESVEHWTHNGVDSVDYQFIRI